LFLTLKEGNVTWINIGKIETSKL